jgi:hypothetical protein
MNIQKTIALCAIAATVVTVGYRAAHAQGAAACNNQPNMAGALASFRAARGSLDHAEHDKGGWRVKAIEATDNAIKETERGCAFADGR